MIYQQEASVIADRLAATAKPLQLLKEHDQMLIEWQKEEMLRQIPDELRLQRKSNDQLQDDISKVDRKNAMIFTGMVSLVRNSAYLPPKSQFASCIIGAPKENQVGEEWQMVQAAGVMAVSQQEHEKEKQEPEQMEATPSLHGSRRSQSAASKNLPSNIFGHGKILSSTLKEFAPFVPPNQNPFDRHANSKMLRGRPSYNDRIMNVSSIKQLTGQQSQYPQNSTLAQMMASKQGYRERTTQPDPDFNIGNVLQLTLGEKRERERGMKPEPIPNPFVRVPPKYLGGGS